MPYSRVFILVSLMLLFFYNSTFADVGCLADGSNNIYKVLNGQFNPAGPGGPYPNYNYGTSSVNRVDQTTVYCRQSSLTICWIGGGGLPSGYGTIITYSVTQCPLDDYIPILLIASGGFGFIVLRNKNSYLSI